MANRVFQNVVYQMKNAIDRVVGVVDEIGTVIACSELGQIGEMREGFAANRLTAGDAFVQDGFAYHQFSNAKHNDYAVFVEGIDTTAEQFAALLSISLQSIKQYHDDTKGGACPPLDTPAEAETCPLSNTLSSIRTTIHFSRSWCGSIV